MRVKPGTRIQSAVSVSEFMVVQAPDADLDLRCGGAPMQEIGAERPADAAPDPAFAEACLPGKRWVDAAGTLEILCTKPGDGSLGLGDTPLQPKESKALPASD